MNFFSFLARIYWDNILSIFISSENISISIFISYQFKSKLDEIMFEKLKKNKSNVDKIMSNS